MSIPVAVPFAVLLMQADDGLTFREVLDSLPADPASLVVLALVLGFIGTVGYFGIRSGEPRTSDEPEEEEGDADRRGSG